jgi:hypothetical protein
LLALVRPRAAGAARARPSFVMRRPPRATGPARRAATPAQLELFATPLQILALDPRRAGGALTRVRDAFLVRYGTEAKGHRVFHDRHGWYCDEHGAACRSVTDVRAAVASGEPPIERATPWPPMVTGDLFDAGGG